MNKITIILCITVAALAGALVVLLIGPKPRSDSPVNNEELALDKLVGDYNAVLTIIDQKTQENTKIVETELQLTTTGIETMNKFYAVGDAAGALRVSQDMKEYAVQSLERTKKYVVDMDLLLGNATKLWQSLEAYPKLKTLYRKGKYILNADGYSPKTRGVALQYLEKR